MADRKLSELDTATREQLRDDRSRLLLTAIVDGVQKSLQLPASLLTDTELTNLEYLRRLGLLESRTEDLRLVEEDAWADETSATDAAVAIAAGLTGPTTDGIIALSYALSVTPPSAGNYAIFLRLAVGRNANNYGVRIASSPTVQLIGGWAYRVTQGGYAYYQWHQETDAGDTWHSYRALDASELVAIRHSETLTTEFLGDITAAAILRLLTGDAAALADKWLKINAAGTGLDIADAPSGGGGGAGSAVKTYRFAHATNIPTVTVTPSSTTRPLMAILKFTWVYDVSLYSRIPDNTFYIQMHAGPAGPLSDPIIPGTKFTPKQGTDNVTRTRSEEVIGFYTPDSLDSLQISVRTQGEATGKDFKDFELVVIDFGAVAAPGSASPGFASASNQKTFYTYPLASDGSPPIFGTSVVYSSGEFSNVPPGWAEAPVVPKPAGRVEYIAFATGHGDGTVTASVTRVTDGFTVRWYATNDVLSSNSYTYDPNVHNYYRLRQSDGTWGPLLPINSNPAPAVTNNNYYGLDDWAILYSRASTFVSAQTATLSTTHLGTIDLDDYEEIVVQIDNRGFGSGNHMRSITVPLPTRFIGLLAAHDDITDDANRGNIFRVSVGGAERASAIALVGDLKQGWERYDGAEIKFMFRRANGADVGSRVVDSIYFFPRVGGYNGGGDIISVEFLGR